MVDTIRMVFTYAIALTIVLGGGLFLYLTYSDPLASDSRVVVAGFMGAAVTFVFTQETSTRSARQNITASESGAVLHANGLLSSATPARAPETRQ
jgi:hypothetical protein